jgi:integrase/recombinase XerD
VAATANQLQAYQSYLASEYRSPSGLPLSRVTLGHHIASIKSWYRWLAMRGRIIADPSRRLYVRVEKSRVVVRQPMTLQEASSLVQTQAALVTAAKPSTPKHAVLLRDLAAICLGLATGRRVGGMTTLRVDDLDLARKELRVTREKGRAGRVLPVAAWAVDVVGIYLREARPHLTRGHDTPWLFLNRPGDGPINTQALFVMLRKLLRRTIKSNPDLDELPAKRISWHSLRVSFATLLFSNGCDIRSVNELLLHRQLSTTALYTPVPIDDLRQVFRSAHPRP